MRVLGKLTVILLLAAMLALAAAPTCRGAEHEHAEKDKICRICGMYIERFIRTAAYVEYNNGKSEAYCGVACAIRAINEKGGLDSVRSAFVTGWTSQEQVAMKDATYVIGSKLVPDMLPNIIAFESGEKAQEFMAKNGGHIESLETLLGGTSYRGLTAPFRIPPAAVPSEGVLNIAFFYNNRNMDPLMKDSGTISNAEGLKSRPMVPEVMTGSTTMLGIGYGFTDDLFCQVGIPEITKNLTSVDRKGRSSGISTNGMGDIQLMNRWRFWHDENYDKHLGLMGAISFPTGDYRSDLRDKPTMQIGTGAFAFTPGLLYSQHMGQFWLHLAGMYTFNLQNSDQYMFGDTLKAGLALHWLPNTSDLLGLEFDMESSLPNTYKNNEVANTGRSAYYYNLVYQRKIALFWGGNMNINFLYGIPAYERVNGIQLGESSHTSIGIQWQRKF